MVKKIFKPVDKNNRIPLYLQIIEQILNSITNGQLVKGDKISNEYKLCEIFGVSRLTLRQALGVLESDGQIYRKRGEGTFIGSKKLETSLMQRAVFTSDELREKGINYKTIIKKKELIKPPTDIQKLLELDKTDKVNYIERLRIIDSEPFNYTIFYISNKYCENFINCNFENKSSVHMIEENYKLKIVKVKRFLEAVHQKFYKKIAKSLNLLEDDCFHYMQSIIYIKKNIPIGYYRDFFPGRKSKFTLTEKL